MWDYRVYDVEEALAPTLPVSYRSFGSQTTVQEQRKSQWIEIWPTVSKLKGKNVFSISVNAQTDSLSSCFLSPLTMALPKLLVILRPLQLTLLQKKPNVRQVNAKTRNMDVKGGTTLRWVWIKRSMIWSGFREHSKKTSRFHFLTSWATTRFSRTLLHGVR